MRGVGQEHDEAEEPPTATGQLEPLLSETSPEQGMGASALDGVARQVSALDYPGAEAAEPVVRPGWYLAMLSLTEAGYSLPPVLDRSPTPTRQPSRLQDPVACSPGLPPVTHPAADKPVKVGRNPFIGKILRGIHKRHVHPDVDDPPPPPREEKEKVRNLWWKTYYENLVLIMDITLDGAVIAANVTVPNAIVPGPEPAGRGQGQGVYLSYSAISAALKALNLKGHEDGFFNDIRNARFKVTDPPTPPPNTPPYEKTRIQDAYKTASEAYGQILYAYYKWDEDPEQKKKRQEEKAKKEKEEREKEKKEKEGK